MEKERVPSSFSLPLLLLESPGRPAASFFSFAISSCAHSSCSFSSADA
jgi:hypothetical protein